MNQRIKLVVSGPVGAGKTTYIKTLSQTEVICTNELASEDIGKNHTTVAMDYGTFQLGKFDVHLYGTPGQERFDFMWEVLCEGAIGLLLLLDASKVSDFSKARKILDFITSHIPIPYMIGCTHLDAERCWGLEEIATYFQVDPERVVGLDPRTKEDTLHTLYRLFANISVQRKATKAERQTSDDGKHAVKT